jgi:hypothetical protein
VIGGLVDLYIFNCSTIEDVMRHPLTMLLLLLHILRHCAG